MTRSRSTAHLGLIALIAAGAAWLAVAGHAQNRPATERWVTTWATALVPRASQPQAIPAAQGAPQGPPRFANQTLRQIVHTSIGGQRLRVVLTNLFGTLPLDVGAARVALRQGGSAIVAGSARPLSFSGRAAVSIPVGAVMISDPVSLTLPPLSDLVIDVHLPGDTGASASPITSHTGALQTGYVSAPGDHTGTAELPVASTITSWFFLARVEVVALPQVGAVALLGDSITDGSRSTADTNNRWPDHLARALARGNVPMGVVNLGVAGNRLLSDGNSPGALARFDREVLVPPGVTHLVVMEGINDIGRGVSAEDVIAAHRQIIGRARARGLVVIGATLTPIEDTSFEGYYTPGHEAARQTVNQWIRTGGAYDAFVDFDAVVRDAARPTRLQSQYASPDFIHPNDAGYRAMADAVDIGLFRPPAADVSR